MKNAMKHVGRWAAGPAAYIAGLITHGIVALIIVAVVVVFLAYLGRGMIRWILESKARSDRATQMISAWRGNAKSLTPRSSSVSRTPSPQRRRRQTPDDPPPVKHRPANDVEQSQAGT